MIARLKMTKLLRPLLLLVMVLLAVGYLAYTIVLKSPTQSIAQLTQQDRVVSYLRQHQRLPDYYLTKAQARALGWSASLGNLCQVASGKAIGGDIFGNREGLLPKKRKRVWREADLNYRCGYRGAERVLFSSDGLIYVTHDHYQRMISVE